MNILQYISSYKYFVLGEDNSEILSEHFVEVSTDVIP
jgi:hypothetical protein